MLEADYWNLITVGRLVWDPTELSYTLVTGVDGNNYLQRRTNMAGPETVAINVERIVFDDWQSSNFTIPADAVRVQLFLRRLDSERVLHRYTAQAVVKLRNTPKP